MAKLSNLILALALVAPTLVDAQQRSKASNGVFEDSTDVGATQKGLTEYDPTTGSYRVTGGGADMWGAADAFHFTWVRLSGDATLTADVRFSSGTNVPLEKAVLIFRQSLDPASAYADVAIHADGHITLQYRAASGAKTEDITSTEHGSTRLRIVRKADRFSAYAKSGGGRFIDSSSALVVLHDPVYVGIGVCAHNADGLATVTFSNVRLERSAQTPAEDKPAE